MENPDRQSIIGRLVFLKRLERYEQENPYYIHVPASAVPGRKSTNEEDEIVEVTIQDLTHQMEAFKIDNSGFPNTGLRKFLQQGVGGKNISTKS